MKEGNSLKFNIAFINFLNNSQELDFFLNLLMKLDEELSKKLNVFIASSVPVKDLIIDIYKKVNSIKLFDNYKDQEFINNLEQVDFVMKIKMILSIGYPLIEESNLFSIYKMGYSEVIRQFLDEIKIVRSYAKA